MHLRGKILSFRSRLNAQIVSDQWLEPESNLGARLRSGLVWLAWAACKAASCVVFGAFCGCSGQNTFLTGGPSVGQLKTSLSHLEYENDQLKRQVAKLEQDSRGLEDRLVQEQVDNGDLAARLDDARNLLRDRGIDADTRLGSHRTEGESRGYSGGDEDGGVHTLPAAQSSRKRRKPPFARIPGRLDDLPRSQDDDDSDSTQEGRPSQSERRRSRSGDDLDHHASRTSPRAWLPVAASNDDGLSRVR